MSQSKNRRGQSINFDYNSNNQLIQETYDNGTIITYEYRASDGLLTNISDNNREANTQFYYNQTENRFTISNSVGIRHLQKL